MVRAAGGQFVSSLRGGGGSVAVGMGGRGLKGRGGG